MKIKRREVVTRLIEFFFVGLVMGVAEDMLAIHFATDATITIQTFKVAFIVALPFAIFSELIADAKWVRRRIKRFLKKLGIHK